MPETVILYKTDVIAVLIGLSSSTESMGLAPHSLLKSCLCQSKDAWDMFSWQPHCTVDPTGLVEPEVPSSWSDLYSVGFLDSTRLKTDLPRNDNELLKSKQVDFKNWQT